MTIPLDTTGYDRVFALDTQMVFEARPLEQLDWASFSPGPVLLLVLPQVSSEIDARKRDGRLGKRARHVNRLLDPSIETGQPATVVAQPVRVDIAYVAAGAIDWGALEDLERDNGDDRIIAQALHALIDDTTRLEVLSFDSRPRAAARRHNLKACKPDEGWLLDPEPSPSDRRVAELEQRVRVLQTTEPQLSVSIELVDHPPLVRHRVDPLPADLAGRVSQMILAKNARQRTSPFGIGGLHENANYHEDYDDYERAIRERDVPAIHLGAARQFSTYPIRVLLENTGQLAAEHVTVELRSGNARLHGEPFLIDLFGPPPPDTRSNFLTNVPNLSQQLQRPDRTSFALENSEDTDVHVEFRCEDFRHGRTQSLTAVLELEGRTVGVVQVEVRVTAQNMRGAVTASMLAPVEVRDTVLGELIDLDAVRLHAAPPTHELLLALIKDDEDGLVHYRNDGAAQGAR
ncbi:hypothetical protein GRI97_10305 [Altererythrobacter xixiisoli]|uniref:PIN domain-containing protein n=1 Tax=Croceibacterium xixiisoli TaxID=1476466 RepID=A0A6I4TW80_9SPHN|nr:hypothetical protein [Croceibacterium xixiisoli]MXO99381.1 hypothetical protein [Croceibacterium xixiisoli]